MTVAITSIFPSFRGLTGFTDFWSRFVNSKKHVGAQVQIGWDYATIVQSLTDGVAFKDLDNKNYEVFSHEGDYIATYPTVAVESTVAWMRREKGIEPGYISRNERTHFTFAWTGYCFG